MNQTPTLSPDPKAVRDATLDGLKRIFLIIVGLAIARALTSAFTEHDSFLKEKLWTTPHLVQLALLGAFLPTAIRFAHGTMLHFSVLTGAHKWRWDMLVQLLQAILFFITALALDDLALFVFSTRPYTSSTPHGCSSCPGRGNPSSAWNDNGSSATASSSY